MRNFPNREEERSNVPTEATQTATEIVFADARARIAWEVGKAITQIAASLPPESQNLKAQTITFEPEDMSRGTYALLFSGTVIGTDRDGVFLVPERSLNILQKLAIPYHAA